MGKYTDIQSPYLQNAIKEQPWENREYIDELIQLNKYINDPPKQWASSLHYRLLREKYEKEYLELLKEKSMELYEKEVKRIEEEQEGAKQRAERYTAELQKLREDWIEAGGKE